MRRNNTKEKLFRDILRTLQIKEAGGDSLLIVNSRVLRKLIDALPEDQAAQFLDSRMDEPNLTENLPLPDWIKAVRELYGVSQRNFAELIRAKGVKVYGSDIGNLELQLRTKNYRPGRLSKIKEAVQELLDEKKAPKTGPENS